MCHRGSSSASHLLAEMNKVAQEAKAKFVQGKLQEQLTTVRLQYDLLNLEKQLRNEYKEKIQVLEEQNKKLMYDLLEINGFMKNCLDHAKWAQIVADAKKYRQLVAEQRRSLFERSENTYHELKGEFQQMKQMRELLARKEQLIAQKLKYEKTLTSAWNSEKLVIIKLVEIWKRNNIQKPVQSREVKAIENIQEPQSQLKPVQLKPDQFIKIDLISVKLQIQEENGFDLNLNRRSLNLTSKMKITKPGRYSAPPSPKNKRKLMDFVPENQDSEKRVRFDPEVTQFSASNESESSDQDGFIVPKESCADFVTRRFKAKKSEKTAGPSNSVNIPKQNEEKKIQKAFGKRRAFSQGGDFKKPKVIRWSTPQPKKSILRTKSFKNPVNVSKLDMRVDDQGTPPTKSPLKSSNQTNANKTNASKQFDHSEKTTPQPVPMSVAENQENTSSISNSSENIENVTPDINLDDSFEFNLTNEPELGPNESNSSDRMRSKTPDFNVESQQDSNFSFLFKNDGVEDFFSGEGANAATDSCDIFGTKNDSSINDVIF